MVMMAGVGVLALGLVVMQANRNAKNAAINTSADRDVDEVMNVLGTIFNTPTSCNLALKGKPYSATTPMALGNLKKNSSDPKNTINFNNYDIFDEGNTTAVVRRNLKISTLSYKLVVPQSTTSTGTRPSTTVNPNLPDSPNTYPASANYRPAILNIIVRFTKKFRTPKLGDLTAVTERGLTKVYIIDVPVVTSTYNTSTNALTDSGTIIGCVRSPASTIAYP